MIVKSPNSVAYFDFETMVSASYCLNLLVGEKPLWISKWNSFHTWGNWGPIKPNYLFKVTPNISNQVRQKPIGSNIMANPAASVTTIIFHFTTAPLLPPFLNKVVLPNGPSPPPFALMPSGSKTQHNLLMNNTGSPHVTRWLSPAFFFGWKSLWKAVNPTFLWGRERRKVTESWQVLTSTRARGRRWKPRKDTLGREEGKGREKNTMVGNPVHWIGQPWTKLSRAMSE